MNKLRTFIREKRQNGEDIKIPRVTRENDDFSNVKDMTDRINSEILEDDGVLQAKSVEISEKTSGFAYFLDGIERKKILFYYKSIPCIYGYVAAAIMGRTDKKMHSIGIESSEHSLCLPTADFPVEEIREPGIKIVNTGKDEPMLPDAYIQAAHSEIQSKRGNLERSLAKQWIEAGYDDGWLFVDGRIENKNKELTQNANIVGIIKSHHACYFEYENQYKIYSMKKGQRSSVFQPEDGKGNKENVFSWYLRLHYDNKHGTNDFGLIRVEVPADERFLQKADLISSWILLETKPVAFPASRWDRMIYPIKYCEDYLKSKAPSYSRLAL